MGCYGDTYCKLCDCPLKDGGCCVNICSFDDSGKITRKKEISSKRIWLTNYLLLDRNNNIINAKLGRHGLKGVFEDNDKEYHVSDGYKPLHKKCFNMLKDKTDYIIELLTHNEEYCVKDKSFDENLWSRKIKTMYCGNIMSRKTFYEHPYNLKKYDNGNDFMCYLLEREGSWQMDDPDLCIENKKRLEKIIHCLINGKLGKSISCKFGQCKNCYIWYDKRDKCKLEEIEEWKDPKLCQQYVSECPHLIEIIPDEFRTLELWKTAIYWDSNIFKKITKIPKTIKRKFRHVIVTL